jgi:hypothetical protein
MPIPKPIVAQLTPFPGQSANSIAHFEGHQHSLERWVLDRHWSGRAWSFFTDRHPLVKLGRPPLEVEGRLSVAAGARPCTVDAAAWGCRCVESRPTTMPRRFPPPWSVDETDACFIVRDTNGQALAYYYS